MILFIILAIVVCASAWLSAPDPCPQVYLGYKHKGDKCDHSSREWALLGIDKDTLTEQPYYWQRSSK